MVKFVYNFKGKIFLKLHAEWSELQHPPARFLVFPSRSFSYVPPSTGTFKLQFPRTLDPKS